MTAGTRDLRGLVIGGDEVVAALGEAMVRYVNFDNRRRRRRCVPPSTPSKIYAGVHRRSGHKSRLCTVAYEQARQTVGALPRRRPRPRHRRVHDEHVVPAPTIAVGRRSVSASTHTGRSASSTDRQYSSDRFTPSGVKGSSAVLSVRLGDHGR